MMMKLPK
jgi:hypothetical protein